MKFECFPCACLGFLRIFLQFTPTIQRHADKLIGFCINQSQYVHVRQEPLIVRSLMARTNVNVQSVNSALALLPNHMSSDRAYKQPFQHTLHKQCPLLHCHLIIWASDRGYKQPFQYTLHKHRPLLHCHPITWASDRGNKQPFQHTLRKHCPFLLQPRNPLRKSIQQMLELIPRIHKDQCRQIL